MFRISSAAGIFRCQLGCETISISRWGGGSQHGGGRFIYAVMVTMLLGGLWHGASWNFVVWGGLHGLAIIIYRYRTQIPLVGLILGRTPSVIGFWTGLLVTQIWVFALWIPFRAESFIDTTAIIMAMFGQIPKGENSLPVWMLAAVLLPVIVDAVIGRRVEVMRQVIRLPVFTYSMIIGGVFALILVLVPLSSAPFI